MISFHNTADVNQESAAYIWSEDIVYRKNNGSTQPSTSESFFELMVNS